MHLLRSRTLVCGAVLTALLSTPALAASLGVPRVAGYAGYTRLAVDVPTGVTYTVEALGAALRVNFTGVSATAATVRVNKPELSGFTVTTREGSVVLTMAAPQGVSKRSGFRLSRLSAAEGKSGYRLVLDFSGAFADTTKLVNPAKLQLRFVPPQPLTVLLDAGHGGQDPGAIGNGVREDSFNLSMAFRVKSLLERVPGVRVELTRTDNRVYSSDKRTDLNARAQASRGRTVFVSIHANAVPRASWYKQFGTEVYYFNPRNQKPLYIAPSAYVTPSSQSAPQRPPVTNAPATNAPETSTADLNVPPVSPLDPVAEPVAAPDPAAAAPLEAEIDPNTAVTTVSDESNTKVTAEELNSYALSADAPASSDDPLSSVPTPPTSAELPVTNAVLTTSQPMGLPLTLTPFDRVSASRNFASSVLSKMLHAMGSANRGVRTADFYVIKYSESPAILVETGFVTHPVEAEQLRNPNYQERIAYGVASGITAYLDSLLAAQ
ncbi:MAG: N-acetylmuramoyl-L-alanine amidase [Pleurocapsa sp. SU_196_0]|nr:N-acetylmuramoyl-L-alanine amidase [Pleurocapsa sp. SU_196_0]